MSQKIDEFLAYASRLVHLYDQGQISETETEIMVMIVDAFLDPERRAEVIRSFTRTISTVPPPPLSDSSDPPLIIESEREKMTQKGREPTVGLELSVPPPHPRSAITRERRSLTYHIRGGDASRTEQLQGNVAKLGDEPTKRCVTIDVRNLPIRDSET